MLEEVTRESEADFWEITSVLRYPELLMRYDFFVYLAVRDQMNI